jgi:hypothetical protein
MTLNLMLTSREIVYLSGDFRVTTFECGRVINREDDFSVQKIVPAIKRNWSALVAWAGIAKTPSGESIGDWLAGAVETIDIQAPFDELERRLLSANSWLSQCRSKDLAFSVVGYVGKKPVALIVSNYLHFEGRVYNPCRPRLEVTGKSNPKRPEVFVAGESKALTSELRGQLKELLIQKCKPTDSNELRGDELRAIAAINVKAAQAAPLSTISKECVVGYLLPNGDGGAVPYGIPDGVDYVPEFIRLSPSYRGIKAVLRKLGPDGKPQPVKWIQMGWKTQDRPLWCVVLLYEMQHGPIFPFIRERGFNGFVVYCWRVLKQSVGLGPRRGDPRWYWF